MTPRNFEVLETAFGAVKVLESLVFADERGTFYESWREEAFDALVPGVRFVQDNQSLSRKGVIRGLHWQGGSRPQGKLVRCVRGQVWDVVADIRAGSPTFGKWHAVALGEPAAGAGRVRMVWVPPGFAHGFLAQSEEAVVEYKCTAPWSRGDEGCLRWDDPGLGVRWPLDGTAPLLSEKDRAGMSLAEYAKRPAFRYGGSA